MRIFQAKGKINFVDTNDVYVGFDNFQCCCESFGFFFSNTIPSKLPDNFDKENKPGDLEDYVFDMSFFKKNQPNDQWNEENFVTFRLAAMRWREVFLTLYNCHNGYYGHGFTVEHGGITVREGGL